MRSFFDHKLKYADSITDIESIFKTFPQSYYLFIPFLGKIKDADYYPDFISSTEIWDSFDRRVMVLRSICTAVKNESWLNERPIIIPDYFNDAKPYFHQKKVR